MPTIQTFHLSERNRHMTDDPKQDARAQLLVRFTDALQHAKIDELNQCLTQDVVWTLPGHSTMSGVVAGPDEVLKRSKAINEYEVTLDLELVTYGYDSVALRLHNHGTHDGRVLNEYLSTVFHFEGDRISRIDTHVSDLEMLNAFFV